ncbi:ankyrin repeat and fibronectin type-III domain-containing protein 1 isoform X1 [Aphis craccivora]|uniref:Ankyrin repeat and fibronectin type-III domain-containing protein 1 isoform X1 n=1 Tax=Aphis craccivora TaxID=307492 RepID=A0A6G0YY77_APHCR|nr:ankyrin repeat and fibronectin type-III domain-containing protein 1 isoform X1 [Aphis craccivora]
MCGMDRFVITFLLAKPVEKVEKTEDEEDEKEENDEEKLNVNDILEWFPRSVSSDSIVESTYCVDLVRRLPSPLSIKVKGRFCPVPPHCPHSSHHGPFDQLIIISTARA